MRCAPFTSADRAVAPPLCKRPRTGSLSSEPTRLPARWLALGTRQVLLRVPAPGLLPLTGWGAVQPLWSLFTSRDKCRMMSRRTRAGPARAPLVLASMFFFTSMLAQSEALRASDFEALKSK